MNARLAFSTAIQVDPDIMLVDEILSVGDIPFREKSFNAFMEFKKKGKTIILVSHDPQQIKSLCDKAIWIHEGIIQSSGNPEKVVDDYTKFILKLKNKKNFKNVSRGYTLNNTLNDFQGKNPLTNIDSPTFAKQVDESCPNGVKDYYAVVLNGSSQYLSRKTEPDIEVGNYSFLAGIWLKSTKKDSRFSLFQYGSGEKGKQMWRLIFVNGSLRANVDDGNTRLIVEDKEANRLLDGKWHFACMLVDRSNLVMHLFADGKSVASADISRIGANSLNSEGENFLIGAVKNRDGKIRGYFQDSLMNFQLYNIADYNLPQILSQGRREIIQMS